MRRLKYIEMFGKYYKILSSCRTSSFGKGSAQVNISGRITLFYVILWLAFSSLVVFAQLQFNNSFVVIVVTLLSIFFTIAKSKLVFKKLENKPFNWDIYKRDLPSKLRPAHVRMLLNDGRVDKKSLIATFVDLIDRGYIELIKNEETKEIIFSKTKKSCDELFEFEKIVLDWLIVKYGTKNQVSSKQISYSLSNDIYFEKPCDIFAYFQYHVWLSFPLRRYYNQVQDNGKKKVIYFFMFIISCCLLMYIWSIPFAIYSLGCLFFATPIYVLNEMAIEEKDNWLDLKKYLLDFSNIEDKTTEMVKIWNFYLTYSIALDIDSISSKEISDIFKADIYNDFDRKDKQTRREKLINIKKKKEKSVIFDFDMSYSIEQEILEESKKYNLD